MGNEVGLYVKISADGKELKAEVVRSEEALGAFKRELEKTSQAAGATSNALSDLKSKGAARLGELAGVSGELAQSISTKAHPAVLAFVVTVGTLVKAYVDGRAEIKAMNLALDMTGNIAGQSAASLRALAGDMAGAGATVGETKKLLTELAGSGQIGAAAFAQVGDAAVAYARATGQSLAEVTPQMVRLFSDPAKGAEELNAKMHFLSVAEAEHIQSMQRQGDVTGAQIELSRALEARMTEIVPKLGAVEAAWKGIQAAGSKAWDAMMGIGREPDTAALLAAARAKESSLGGYEAYYKGSDAAARRLAAHQEVLRLEQQLEDEANKRWAEGEQAKQNQREQSAQAMAASYSKTLQIRKLQDERVLAQSIQDENVRLETIRAIEEKIAKIKSKGTGGAKATQEAREFQDAASVQAKAYADLYTAGAKYAQGVEQQLVAGRKLTEGEKILATAKDKLTAAQYAEVEAVAAWAIEAERAMAIDQAWEKNAQDKLKTLDDQLERLEKEVEYYGLTESAIQDKIIAELEEQRAIAVSIGLEDRFIQKLDQEIAKRKQVAAAARSKEALDANKEAGEDLARNMDRAAQDINRSLADAIMRGGESAGE